LVSRSRDALIHALTLRSEDAVAPEAWRTRCADAATEDLSGEVTLKPNDPAGDVLREIRFAIRLKPDAAYLTCRGILTPKWQTWVKESLGDLKPQPLLAPPDGMIGISMNLNAPLRDLYAAASPLLAEQIWLKELWPDAPLNLKDGAGALAQTAVDLVGPLGPGIRLSWCGIDLNEMIPMPEIVLTLDADPEAVLKQFATLPPLSDGPDRYDIRLQYDPQTKRAHLPLIGGPSIEPTAGLLGRTLLISSSRMRAVALLDAGAEPTTSRNPGNLHVSAKPQACLDAVLGLGRLLADNHLLKGYTAESLDKAAAPWLQAASTVQEISALAAYNQGAVTVEIILLCK
jgi:hypothetical protein